MTKEEKIKGVMELVREMGDADFYAGNSSALKDGQKHEENTLKASELEIAIESKLRELIQ